LRISFLSELFDGVRTVAAVQLLHFSAQVSLLLLLLLLLLLQSLPLTRSSRYGYASGSQETCFTCQADSIRFLVGNKFDFNKLFNDGTDASPLTAFVPVADRCAALVSFSVVRFAVPQAFRI
jgi:hypothetical protein